MIMIEHVKWRLLQKESHELAFWFKSYASLKFKNAWQWFDHNLPTINEKWVFLDFLERQEQDLQLSCWTNFDLKLSWTCNFEENDFPFWAGENYRSLPFWETFVLPQILHYGCLKCQMKLIWTWMRPFQPSHTFKFLIKCTVDHSWLF